VVYGKVSGRQWFTGRELTVDPGCTCEVVDLGATSFIVVQGEGTANGQPISSPAMIGFHELTQDEYFVSWSAARAGVTYVNRSRTEPLVLLRYFGPDVDPGAPEVGAHLQ
jgi:hypothetical protein